MARLIVVGSSAEYANEGEQEVARAFARGLPAEVDIYPNVEVLGDRGRVDEIDLLVVADGILFVIETKTYVGRVSFQNDRLVVDGEQRNDPYRITNAKARRVKSRMVRSNPMLNRVWVGSLVVLSRAPKQLEVCQDLKAQVVLVDKALHVLAQQIAEVDPRLAGTADRLRIADALGLKPRRPSRRIGSYRLDEVVSRTSDALEYRSTHAVSGESFKVKQLLFDPAEGQETRSARRRAALRAFDVAKLARSPLLEPPGEVIEHDDGSLFLATPAVLATPLVELTATDDLPPVRRASIVRSVAAALALLHEQGVVHGSLSARCILVRPDGSATLADLDRAQLPTSTGGTVVRSDLDKDFSSPQALGGRPDPAEDLYALGRLIWWLWPERPEPGRPEPVGPPPPDLAEARDSLTLVDPASRAPTPSALAGTPPENSDDPRLIIFEGGAEVEKFRLLRRLGGEHGRVWLAFDRVLQEERVVKILRGPDELASGANQLRALRDIRHPGLATLREVVMTAQEDIALLVSDHVDGTAVGEAIASGRRLDPIPALRLVRTALEALACLHSVVHFHGDVSPANLLIADDRLVIVDFDQCVPPGSESPAGTPGYVPPDVDFSARTASDDLFGLGVILLELMTGPLDRTKKRIEVPEEAFEVVLRAMAPAGTTRYESAAEMLWAIERATDMAKSAPTAPARPAATPAAAGARLNSASLPPALQAILEAGGFSDSRPGNPVQHASPAARSTWVPPDDYDDLARWNYEALRRLAVGRGHKFRKTPTRARVVDVLRRQDADARRAARNATAANPAPGPPAVKAPTAKPSAGMTPAYDSAAYRAAIKADPAKYGTGYNSKAVMTPAQRRARRQLYRELGGGR